jgi:hypothetical protein
MSTANVPIRMEQGGAKLVVGTGGVVTPETGTQAATIAARPTNLADGANGAAIATAVNGNATAINAILVALKNVGIVASE